MGLFGRTKTGVANDGPDNKPLAATRAGAAESHRIGESLAVTGELRFAGRCEFNGRITGDVIAEPLEGSCFVVGPAGHVEGRIEAETVIIRGRVEGPVRAHRRLDVESGARLVGDIGYRDLQIQHGAVVEGMLRSLDSPPATLKLVANSRT